MVFVLSKYTIPYLLVLTLYGSVQQATSDSFMDQWLRQQKAMIENDSLAQQVAPQVDSPSKFNQDDWLARQKSTSQGDWLARQASAQVASSDSFSQDAWLARQEESSGSSNKDGALSQQAWTPAVSWEADEDLEKSLLSDIEETFGKDHRQAMEGRIVIIEENMRPMFQALPKNEYGKLGHPSVRYMLHRFFVEQHGWFIDGLFSEGAALNTSSPSRVLKDRVPMFVEGLFERRLGGRGFGIHEMAVLVAVVEDSVHQESQAALKDTYGALGIHLDTNFNAEQVELLIEVYMSGFILNTNMSEVSANKLYRQTRNMLRYYPTWLRARDFFRTVVKKHRVGKETLSFPEISGMVRELVETFGTFHGRQCQGLKQSLKGMEKNGSSSGCVNLPDFYDKGLKHDTNWLFVESPDYLRHIGVLDESNPGNPRLLSANYINSPTNCLQPSGYYLVCCHNECDDILGYLERQLGSPSATPAEIVFSLRSYASSFAAPSLRASRLAPALRRRLQEVAAYHGGRVPIHGRLFAQWLHHVYPHECSYPHASGSKRPQWMEDFEEETGKLSHLTGEEMASFVHNASKASTQSDKYLSADAGSCAPWQQDEELFAPLPRTLPVHDPHDDPHVWNVAGGIAFLSAVTTFTISLARTCRAMRKLKYQPKMLQV